MPIEVEAKAAAGGWRRVPAITEKPFVPLREPGGYASYSIVKDNWKLVHNLAPEPLPPGAPPMMALPAPPAPEYELFDHAADPLDTKNVAGEHPEVVEELAAELERWRQMATSKKLASENAPVSAPERSTNWLFGNSSRRWNQRR